MQIFCNTYSSAKFEGNQSPSLLWFTIYTPINSYACRLKLSEINSYTFEHLDLQENLFLEKKA